jgi:DNA polymerase-3 subunit alpha
MIDYAHLHCHTKYSAQDAMPSHKAYVDAIYEHNKNSTKYNCIGFAATDHGNVYGLVKHYNACNNPDHKERKTKAIYGCEIYHCVDLDMNPNQDRYHLVLIPVTQEGLTNMYQIVSHAGLHLIHGRQKDFPVTDLKFMKDHGKGIVVLTACVAGIVPQCIINGQDKDALSYIDILADIFDEVYLELQPHDFPEQLMVNSALVNISAQTGYKLVMTSDSHYINQGDSQYHNILKNMCHQKLFTTNNHLYTPEEMEEYCIRNNIPLECIGNTAEIAKMANVDPKPKDHRALLPVFPCPEGYDESSYLRKLSFEKLQEKILKNKIDNPVKYIKQMVYELEIICNAGFAGYFLILWDWFEWCRKNDILCGPGRGSAAGSVISYALNITKVDPIKNGFFFERFLNAGRLEFPDIDTDIPRSQRAKAIGYLRQKYGVQNVSQIITFGQYKLKNTIKAIMSFLGCSFQESNEVTRDIPDIVDGHAVTYDLIEDVANNPDSEKYNTMSDREKQGLKKNYDKLQEIFQKYPIVYAGIQNICGCISSTGIHAGGVIVSNKPINENAGVIDGGDTAVLPLIQFEMADLDFFGFLKIDALGLKTLDVIKETMDLAGLDYDWYDSEDYSDPAVYDMLRAGETTDVFQMSSYTPTVMLADFDVHDIDGICAVNAGNRPGPLEKDLVTGKSMVDLYIERKKTGVIESWHPDIDPILKDTMGCIWYQEHCMSIGQIMAGYDLGGADLRIRKPLGKKLKKKIPEIKNEFIYGKQSEYDEDHNVIGIKDEPSEYCVGSLARGYSQELSEKIFESMEAFAKYAFNKSHSFCYAVLGFKTADLSCHYPVEFAIANCTVNEDQENITATLSLAKKRKIDILPPDINHSKAGFCLDNGAIRYGLKAIKGVGSSVLNFINEYKQMDPVPFADFDDYYMRIHNPSNPVVISLLNNLRTQTGKNSPNPMKKDVEVALILSGAFDYCEPNRYKLLNHYLVDIKKEKTIKIMNDTTQQTLPLNEKDYKRKVKLALEKHYMGSYISEHPLDPFPYADFESAQENEVIRTTGIITGISSKLTKKGKEYLSIKFKTKDDIERTVNVFDLDETLKLKGILKKNQIIIVKGKVSKKYNNINASNVSPVAFTKQSIDTEDIEIEDKTNKAVQQPWTPQPSTVEFGNIF